MEYLGPIDTAELFIVKLLQDWLVSNGGEFLKYNRDDSCIDKYHLRRYSCIDDAFLLGMPMLRIFLLFSS
jgi:hypothetical protein